MAFGTLLRRYRIAAGLTQEELAERAGISLRSLGNMERGARTPHRDTLALVAAALGLSAGEQAVFLEARRRGSAAATVAAPDGLSTPPFVGRTRERALLERHLAGQGPPVLLFAGEPGIGKTRLLQAAIPPAVAAGWRVLDGGCQRRGGPEPYAPLLEALQRFIRRRSPAQLHADLQGCAWLVRLLPELMDGPIPPLPPWTLRPEQEQRLLAEAVQRFLANIAGPRGTLLLLDDLQWAGQDALDLIGALARAAAEVPLRLIGAYRDTEVPPAAPLALADLAQAGLAVGRALDPLAAAEAAQLLAGLLGEDDGAAPRHERLLERAGGVPFFLVSWAQALSLDGAEPGTDGIPWDVEHSILQRVARLPRLAQEVVQVVALLGGMVPLPLLLEIIGEPEPSVLAALDAAWQARLLIEGEQGYQCAHDLIHEVIEMRMGGGRRAMLHRHIAEALERHALERGAEPPLAVLAYHYERSSAPDQALRYLELAGDRARCQPALGAAEAYYRTLVSRLDGLGRLVDSARVREKRGGVLATLGWYDAALVVLEQAADTMQAVGDLDGLGQVMAQMAHIHYQRGTVDKGIACLHPILERLEARGPSAALARLYTALAELNLHGGQWAEEVAAAERAGQVARLVGDEGTSIRAEYLRGSALFLMGRAGEGLSILEETIRRAEAAGEVACLVQTLYSAAWICEERGELEQVARYTEWAIAAAERLGDPVLIGDGIIKRGVVAHVRGRWEQARRHYAQVQEINRQIGISPLSCTWGAPLLVLGRVSLVEGAWDEAAIYLQESARIGATQGKRSGLRHTQSALAERDILMGSPEAACARLMPLLDRAGVQECVVTTAILPVLAWAYLERGETEQAARTVEEAIRRARPEQLRLSLVEMLRVQALVALRQGDWIAAERALEDGLSVARGIGCPYGEARLLHVYGHVCAAAGASGPARERLEAALAIFQQLGARQDSAQVERDLAAMATAPGWTAPQDRGSCA